MTRGRGDAGAPAFSGACPAPVSRYDRIVLGHGSGGRLSHDLLRDVFVPAFGQRLHTENDQATVPIPTSGRLSMTTDAFVVSPPFFPGGSIGDLAVNGTINDLAVGGAVPLYLSAAFILEEGFDIASLASIARSMRRAADAAGVDIITGDTKVVERGRGHGVFITTTGVGMVPLGRCLSASGVRPGDAVIVSGTLGDHGIAILASREGIELETDLQSDTRPLVSLVAAILTAAPNARCLRDATRGGVSSALGEIAASSRVGFCLDEVEIPVRPQVAGACELLGLDPLYVANEGKLVAIVPKEEAEACLDAMRRHPDGQDARRIGYAVQEHPSVVTIRSLVGGERIVPMLSGDQLPRIC